MLRNFILGSFFFGILTLTSCGPSGPKPDKRIDAYLGLKAANPSEEDINEAILALQRRFEKFNAFPSVKKLSGTEGIHFSLETHVEPERILKFLDFPGNLEFYPCMLSDDLLSFLGEVDEWLMKNDSLEANPILSKLVSSGWGSFAAAEKDTATMATYLRRNDVLNLLGKDKRRTKFLWGKADKDNNNFPLYAVKTNASGKAPLDGSSIERAIQAYSIVEMPTISIQMNSEGAAVWERLTQDAYDNQSLIAIVIDGVVYSAPGVVSGAIKGGRSEISGDFTLEEARDLAAGIGSGSIPEMEILNYTVQPLE